LSNPQATETAIDLPNTYTPMIRSIFVTGAGGFLGSRVVKRLSQDKARRIVCLIRGTLPDSIPSNVNYVQGDLLDPAVYAANLKGCEAILHMAAATGKLKREEYLRVNRDGTQVLVRQARQSGVNRFLFVSTVAAKFRDQYRYHYAESKQAAEAAVAESGLKWTIVRPAMILGKNSPVLNSLARLAALPVVPVFGDGRVPVQPVFVDDLADCLVDLLDQGDGLENSILEVGGPEVLNMEELVLRIRRSAGKASAPVVHLPVRAIARFLGWMEPLLLPLLPFTAGQLASFSNAGTAAPHPWVLKRQNQMRGITEMLRSTANGYGSA
jgi:nucleoside-diphosphate-sugar epimerase